MVPNDQLTHLISNNIRGLSSTYALAVSQQLMLLSLDNPQHDVTLSCIVQDGLAHTLPDSHRVHAPAHASPLGLQPCSALQAPAVPA
jgi:hypothetical protein